MAKNCLVLTIFLIGVLMVGCGGSEDTGQDIIENPNNSGITSENVTHITLAPGVGVFASDGNNDFQESEGIDGHVKTILIPEIEGEGISWEPNCIFIIGVSPGETTGTSTDAGATETVFEVVESNVFPDGIPGYIVIRATPVSMQQVTRGTYEDFLSIRNSTYSAVNDENLWSFLFFIADIGYVLNEE